MRVRIDDRAAAVLFTAKRNSYAVFRARRTGEKGALIELDKLAEPRKFLNGSVVVIGIRGKAAVTDDVYIRITGFSTY